MNAILREEREAPVLTNEAIEVHLSYLRPGVDEVRKELPEIRKEIKALDEKLSGRIDAVDEKLSAKIEAVDQKLSGKIDAVDEKLSGEIEALDTKLTDRIDKLTELFMKLQASQDGFKWFIGSLALLASGASLAHSLGWI